MGQRMLAYAAYTYAYAVFGARFNDAFLSHIAILSTSLFAGVRGPEPRPGRDRRGVAVAQARSLGRRSSSHRRGRGWGTLWGFLIVRNALAASSCTASRSTGSISCSRWTSCSAHPLLVVSGVLLWRERPMGYVLGPAMAVMGTVCQLNPEGRRAVPGSGGRPRCPGAPARGIVLTAAFVVAALVILAGRAGRHSGSALGASARRV
ncbi:MAG: hypothetical protein U0V56_06370 [Actinomycetota bacterium]